MEAVKSRKNWKLLSPKDNSVVKEVDAFDLWQKILITRVETGEPYLYFTDTVNKMLPTNYLRKGWGVSTSNLCTEIFLHTDSNYSGVCCLASLNLEYFDEYQDELQQVTTDMLLFLDNVLQAFIDNARDMKGFEAAVTSAEYERSVGLGVMGLHSYLQSKSVPIESAIAVGMNKNIFTKLADCTTTANIYIGKLKGVCPLSKEMNTPYRFTNTTAIAPTASISTLCNVTSQGIDPRVANTYSHKTKIGTHLIKNKYLEVILDKYGMDTDEIWKSIKENQGSVQHLEIDTWDKDVFKTAYEIDNMWLIEMAGTRQKYIDQGQSINIFIPSDADVEYLYNIHMSAWAKGCKSLYYCRSTTSSRAVVGNTSERKEMKYDECLSCQ